MIELLSREAFRAERAQHDALVASMPDIDTYCSQSAWGLAAHAAFQAEDPCCFLKGEHGYASFACHNHGYWGRTLLPLESSWLLGCPIATVTPLAFMAELRSFLAQRVLSWEVCILSGMAIQGQLAQSLIYGLGGSYRIGACPPVLRRIAQLGPDLEGFLGRREPKFRKNLRRTERLVAAAGIGFQWWQGPLNGETWPRLYDRVIAVERRGWKGQSGHGIDTGQMRVFYQNLMAIQAPEGAIRLGFARLDERDIGYILGGVSGTTYRGYQFSYDEAFARLGLGNWMQVRAIEELTQAGIRAYDLGSDMVYKETWSDLVLETTGLLIKRDPA